MTHNLLLLLLDALACYRLTRLVVADTITEPLRELARGKAWTDHRDMGGNRIPIVKRPKLAEWVTCPWCTSPYLAVIIVLLQTFIPHAWFYVSVVLAFSAAAGLISKAD